jgi:hypothetical protein
MFSNDDGGCVGYCDFPATIAMEDFIKTVNKDELGFVSAICVDEIGQCIHPMEVHAELGMYAVIKEIMLCPNEILSQHARRDEAVREATELVVKFAHTTQGLGGWGVIDDRGILVWRDTPHYHNVNESAAA